MSVLKPAPEGQPTSSVKRFLDHAKELQSEWEGEVARLKRSLAVAERAVQREAENVVRYDYQLHLRRKQGRDD